MAATSNHRPSNHRSSNNVENLESRILCRAPRPAKIATAYLDNRGQAFLTVTVPLDPSTLSRKTAALYSAGTDGVFGTADDARLYTKVGYRKGRLSLRADSLGLNDKYRVILNASVIKDVNGLALDGEFNGMPEISGDGTPGGNYDVVSTPAAKTKARFTTVAGYVNVGLYRNTPNTKANFAHYANEGAWDGTVFHRSVRQSAQGFDIIQGGGFNVGSDDKVHTIHQETGIGLELGNSHVRGTIGMARTSDPNSNTNQWFFNTQSNTSFDANYTAFGAVLDQESLNTLDALAAMPTADVPNYTPDAPYTGQTFNDVPVIDAQKVIDRSPQAAQHIFVFDPKVDYPSVQRVAFLFDIAATPGTAAAAAAVTRSVAATPAAANPAIVSPATTTSAAHAVGLFATTKSGQTDSLFADDAA